MPCLAVGCRVIAVNSFQESMTHKHKMMFSSYYFLELSSFGLIYRVCTVLKLLDFPSVYSVWNVLSIEQMPEERSSFFFFFRNVAL